MRKRYYIILTVIITISVIFLVLGMFSSSSRKITFQECVNAGGEAWFVDLFHPDICSDCDSYRNCLEENRDQKNLSELCPQVSACSECISNNHPYPDKCPDDKRKIGEISDAAICFQCCKEQK